MIVFAHVPKTAGTSITSVIVSFLRDVVGATASQWMLFGREIPYDRTDLLERLPSEVRFLSGHFRGPHYEQLLPQRPFVFASMRDPFERFCSGLEHVHRLLEGGLPASPEMLSKGRWFLDEINRDRRDGVRIEQAMRSYRKNEGPSLGRRRILAYGNRLVAHAKIESTEVRTLCERLADASPKRDTTLAMLLAVSRENVWPAGWFADYSAEDLTALEEAFATVFSDELELVRLFREEVPSLFEADPWECFLSRLATGRATGELREPPEIPEWLNTAA
jgi:hypothetical protein